MSLATTFPVTMVSCALPMQTVSLFEQCVMFVGGENRNEVQRADRRRRHHLLKGSGADILTALEFRTIIGIISQSGTLIS